MNIYNFLLKHEKAARVFRVLGVPAAYEVDIYNDYASTTRLNPDMKKKRVVEILSRAYNKHPSAIYRTIKKMETLIDSKWL